MPAHACKGQERICSVGGRIGRVHAVQIRHRHDRRDCVPITNDQRACESSLGRVSSVQAMRWKILDGNAVAVHEAEAYTGTTSTVERLAQSREGGHDVGRGRRPFVAHQRRLVVLVTELEHSLGVVEPIFIEAIAQRGSVGGRNQ